MSDRQRRKARIRARKRADLEWLQQHPELFAIPGWVPYLQLMDYGWVLLLAYVEEGATPDFWLDRMFRLHAMSLSKRVGKRAFAARWRGIAAAAIAEFEARKLRQFTALGHHG